MYVHGRREVQSVVLAEKTAAIDRSSLEPPSEE
jgi:hypothetical protein